MIVSGEHAHKFLNPKNHIVHGYVEGNPGTDLTIHISPYNAYTPDNVNFRAVVGHELIHIYHRHTVLNQIEPAFTTNTERVAYRYSYDLFFRNGRIQDALKVMKTAIKLNYWGIASPGFTNPIITH